MVDDEKIVVEIDKMISQSGNLMQIYLNQRGVEYRQKFSGYIVRMVYQR